MDRIEDEVEAHAYEDLVPLDIKLALEERVFGWTHFTSAVLGHIVFTCGAFKLVYEISTFLLSEAYGFRGKSIPAYWQFIREFFSLWAAFNTYRMVRRRRHVWFRAPYGSQAYKQDAARRKQELEETDKMTALGRMMQSYRHRRVLKKLRKAETIFAKKTQSLRIDGSVMESLNQSQASHSSDESSSDDRSCSSTVSSNSALSSTLSTTSIISPGKRKRRHKKPSFHTKPTDQMQSYAHDQVMFPTIEKMPYAHGGYFGAAPFLLSNPHWISILRHLMPDVYVEISRRVANSPPSRLIHWAENNPVVAAYAAAHELEYHDSKTRAIPNIEWDVFLNPSLVDQVQLVLDEREKFLKSESDLTTEKAKQIRKYYDKELAQRSKLLTDKMLIAHGNLNQLIFEQTGFAKYYNYSRVKRTRRTLGGGIYARQWIAVFAEALKLGVGYRSEEESQISPKAKRKSSSLFDLTDSKVPETSMLESIRMLEAISKCKNPVGLVLDIKSRHVSKEIWSIVIDTLRNSGIRVEGIASFFVEEIRHVSQRCESFVDEYIFFHSAGDLQKACTSGLIHEGDAIFFNAGSLLWEPGQTDFKQILSSDFDPKDVMKNYTIQPFGKQKIGNAGHSTIAMYKEKYKLRIGLYCQEFSIDDSALRIISNHVNANPDLFDLGFAWGGVNGVTIKGISPNRVTSTDGLWNQRYLGQLWDYNQYPE